MKTRLDDFQIKRILSLPKPLPENYQESLLPRPKRGHAERELDIHTTEGTEFRIIVRQSLFNPLDFSVILAYRIPKTNQVFRLKRYNGKSHEHENKLEGVKFYDYHVHTATERYQDMGFREDAYAEPTDRFVDLKSAMRCMLRDCGFEIPKPFQPGFFDEEI
jgi:hypothetical protein